MNMENVSRVGHSSFSRHCAPHPVLSSTPLWSASASFPKSPGTIVDLPNYLLDASKVEAPQTSGQKKLLASILQLKSSAEITSDFS